MIPNEWTKTWTEEQIKEKTAEGIVPSYHDFAVAQQMDDEAEEMRKEGKKAEADAKEKEAAKLRRGIFEAINSLAGQGVYGVHEIVSC